MRLAVDVNGRAAPVAGPVSMANSLSLDGTASLLALPVPRPTVVSVYATADVVVKFGDSSVVVSDTDGDYHVFVPAMERRDVAMSDMTWTHLSVLGANGTVVRVEYY